MNKLNKSLMKKDDKLVIIDRDIRIKLGDNVMIKFKYELWHNLSNGVYISNHRLVTDLKLQMDNFLFYE
jgi:hypothetical protein